ncbi:hypothetical protein [Humisphaera borealis]|nr:hypothetical protein [Humisphaera borealis]
MPPPIADPAEAKEVFDPVLVTVDGVPGQVVEFGRAMELFHDPHIYLT